MERTIRSENSMVTGVIWKQLLLFFFPIMLGSLFQQLYNTVDAIVVGKFVGTDAGGGWRQRIEHTQSFDRLLHRRIKRRNGNNIPIFWCKRSRRRESRTSYGYAVCFGRRRVHNGAWPCRY